MKKYIIFALFLIIVPASMLAFAPDDQRGPAIYTFTTTTPAGKPLRADEEIVYSGKTCNTMTIYDDFRSVGNDYVLVVQKQSIFDSNVIVELAGPAHGCFKVDIVVGDRALSTGPIALIWDHKKNEYIAANPSSGMMNF